MLGSLKSFENLQIEGNDLRPGLIHNVSVADMSRVETCGDKKNLGDNSLISQNKIISPRKLIIIIMILIIQ